MKCEYCSNPVPPGAAHCPSCGAAVSQAAAAPQPAQAGAPGAQQVVVNVTAPAAAGVPKSRVTYVILAFLLGGLGVHDFYAGRTGLGVLLLLMSLITCGVLAPISALIALIEAIVVTTDGHGVRMS